MLELTDLSRAITGLGLVLLLLVGVLWLVKRLVPHHLGGRQTGQRRLAVIETLPLDPRTRLVLVRCDALEHLVIVSTQGGVSLVPHLAEAAGSAASPMAQHTAGRP